jgi:hypothetical protein
MLLWSGGGEMYYVGFRDTCHCCVYSERGLDCDRVNVA